MAREAGHEITTDASAADVLVVNTCAFIDSAKQESIDAILEMAAQKRDGSARGWSSPAAWPSAIATSCRREIPEIDAVLGTGEVEGIVEAIGARGSGLGSSGSDRWRRDRSPLQFFRECTSGRLSRAPNRRVPSPDSVPTTSTTPTPRAPDDAEALRLRQGRRGLRLHVRVLHHPDAARHVSQPDGGLDRARGARRSPSAASASCCSSRRTRRSSASIAASAARSARLLRELNEIDGLAWIRLLYLYPTTITDDVLAAMAECEKVCRYIDLPLQHASAEVLKRMRRPGQPPHLRHAARADPRRVPDVTLRTTLIVGFPGETDADFAELDGFVADTGVRPPRRLHVFARGRHARLRP